MESAQTGKLNNGFSVSTEQCEYMFVAGRVFHFEGGHCMHLVQTPPMGF